MRLGGDGAEAGVVMGAEGIGTRRNALLVSRP